jgi:hypothetical protein
LIDNPSWNHFASHDESEYPELWQGVRGYWAPCLGPSGTRLHDASGRANWGALTNFDLATDWVVDAGRYALNFDASNNVVTYSTDAVSLAGDFTFSIWARPSVSITSNRTLCQKQSGGLSLFLLNDTVFSARSQTGGLITWTIPSVGTVWNHFCFVRSGTTARVYANGRESTDGSKTFTGTFLFDCLGSVISPSTTLNGRMDDVIFWSNRLTQNEILSLYQIGRGGMLTPRRRRRAYFAGVSGLRRRLLLTGQV